MKPHPVPQPLRIILGWLLLVGLLNAAPQSNTGNVRLITKETSLGKVPLMAVMKEFLVSPDCRHIAFPVRRGGKWTVCLDGVEGEKYDRAKHSSSVPTAGDWRWSSCAVTRNLW